ncbi:MAG: hypothetical protein PVI90_01840 [Desulfobacteraceae bacterium]|jgi:hypothetical protein
MPRTELNILDAIIGKYNSTIVFPNKFFVSWNSVVTLAYSGFSTSLLEIKAEIEQRIPELKPENPGSKWPKTTLGCLMDGEILSSDEVDVLRNICNTYTSSLENTQITISHLDFVLFQCRTLEKRLLTHKFKLNEKPVENDSPPKWHKNQVKEVMDQFSERRKAVYYQRLSPEGRTLWSYYRKPHVEATLVADIQFPAQIRKTIDNFRNDVNNNFKGKFGWFEPDSWHLTIRGLVFP